MLRALLLSVICLVFSSLYAQPNVSVQWKYENGTVGSGILWYLPKAIKETDELFLRDSNGEKNRRRSRSTFDLQDISWLVHEGDTIVKSLWYEGRSYLVQPIYQGEAVLYRTIGEEEYPYFFFYQGQAIPMREDDSKTVGDQLLQTDCPFFHPVKRLRNEAVAVEMARQINHCLTSNDADSEHANAPIRWRVGGGVDCWRGEQDLIRLGNFSNPSFVFKMPRISLAVDYAPFRAAPGLVTELQVRANYLFTTEEASINGVKYRESLKLSNLYLYPGIGVEMAKRRFFEPFLYVGATMAVPLHFRRTFEFVDPQLTLASFPVRQEINKGQAFSVGMYVSFGFRVYIRPQWTIGVNVRNERLRQKFRYRSENFISSSSFQDDSFHLSPEIFRFLQVQMKYNW